MTPQQQTNLQAKRDALNQQIEAERRKIPAEARRFVEQADTIIAQKNAGLDELVEARNKIEEEFGIGAADAAQRQAAKRRQEIVEKLNELATCEEERLSAVDRWKRQLWRLPMHLRMRWLRPGASAKPAWGWSVRASATSTRFPSPTGLPEGGLR